MGRFADRLGSYRRVGIDTSPFIYEFEDHPTFSQPAHELFEALSQGNIAGCTSVLTLIETTIVPLRAGMDRIARRYRTAIVRTPNLMVIDVDREIAARGARFRAIYRLQTADALQLAACIHAGANVFVTNVRQLQRVTEIPVLLLSDFVDS